MAARKQAVTADEFISREEAERMAQVAAGRVLATMPEPEPEIPEMHEDDPDDIALANVIADLGGPGIDAKVNVYLLDANRNKSFVRSFLPSEFSLEAVQSEYGPGDYEIHVRKDGKLATRKVLKIATPRKIENLPVNPAVETGKILETMQNGFKEMGAMFANALAGLAANQPKPKTTMEMLQEMTMMKDMLGLNNPVPVAPAGPDPMQLFEMATQIAEKITPRTGEPGAGEVILEAIKNFGPVLTQAAQRQPAPVMPLPAHIGPPVMQNPLPVHTGETPIPVPLENQPQGNDEMNIAKKMYLNLLVSNAAANNDPSTYANLMLDVAGEAAALEFANAPDWFERLCAEEPRAAQHRPWFEELRGMVLELTKPENTGIDTPIDEQPGKPPTI